MARTNTAARRTGTTIAFTLMLLGALTMVLPFLWMLSTSLKESRLVFDFPPQWIPNPDRLGELRRGVEHRPAWPRGFSTA